jgi:hypothetical protein
MAEYSSGRGRDKAKCSIKLGLITPQSGSAGVPGSTFNMILSAPFSFSLNAILYSTLVDLGP